MSRPRAALDVIRLLLTRLGTMSAHPVAFIVVGAFAVPIGMTAGWHSFAAFLLRNVAPHL